MHDLTAGLRYLFATPLLRSITVTVAMGAFAAAAGNSMLVLYARNELHLRPFGYGVLLACLAVGWVASSFFVDRLVRRYGYAASMRVSQLCAALSLLLIAVVPPWPVLVGAVLMFLTGTALVWNVCSQSSRQRFTPPELLGRVLTSHRALAWGLTPLGALAGGLVAVHWTLRGVWVMAAAAQLLGILLVWRRLSPEAFREAEAAAAA
jgi:predicted MFS family arabinose efflux permease